MPSATAPSRHDGQDVEEDDKRTLQISARQPEGILPESEQEGDKPDAQPCGEHPAVIPGVEAHLAAGRPLLLGAAVKQRGESGEVHQNTSFSVRYAFNSEMGIRTCSIESRSRTVTQPSAGSVSLPTVWKSTVMQKGVPISSWRR